MPKNAQLTKILTRSFLLILALIIIAGIYFDKKFFQKSSQVPVTVGAFPEAKKIKGEETLTKNSSTQKNEPSGSQKNLNDQKIPQCLSSFHLQEMPKNLRDLRRIFEKKIGKPEKEKMLWRNVHYLEKDGSKRRLRVELRASGEGDLRYEMRLFSVDAEDLPIPLKLPDSERFSPSTEVLWQYLNGKNIDYDSSSVEYYYADGAILETEVENEAIKIFHYRGKDFSLGCSLEGAASSLDCSCLR